MIVQIYKTVVWNQTKKKEEKITIHDPPLIIEFLNIAKFHQYRKQMQWKEQKLVNKGVTKKEDLQKLQIDFTFRKLI